MLIFVATSYRGYSGRAFKRKLALRNSKALTQGIYRGKSSEKIVQCNISLKLSRKEKMSQRFQPENLLRQRSAII